MPFVLLTIRSGIERVQVPEHRLPHQPRVQGRDAVDLVRAEEGEVPHADAPAVALVDERDGFELSRSARPDRLHAGPDAAS